MSIQVTRSSMPKLEEYIEEIKDLWDSKWLTNMGEKHNRLEKELIKYLGVSNISLFTNGHLALESAIEVLDLKGEVITTPFTFISTTHAIVRNGLKPVFCDINPHDYTIDTEKLKKLINENTSAILPVHVYGSVCDVYEINKIAKKYGLKVIYDAAHSFGTSIDGVGIGNFGDASMFSFHATKVFNTIEGGAVTFKDESLKHKLDTIKNFGITGSESIGSIGTNAKMNEFQAAMGLCNLKYIDENISLRKNVVERYRKNLENIKGIKLLKEQKSVKSNYSYFPVVFDGYKKSRDEVFEQLKDNNIYARKYFYPLANSVKCYDGEFNYEDNPVAKHISDRVLCLPLYSELSLNIVDDICYFIKK